jgi:hypothetical protein
MTRTPQDRGLSPKDASISGFLRGGWGTWIRTKTNRVRVCCATVTPFPNGFPNKFNRLWNCSDKAATREAQISAGPWWRPSIPYLRALASTVDAAFASLRDGWSVPLLVAFDGPAAHTRCDQFDPAHVRGRLLQEQASPAYPSGKRECLLRQIAEQRALARRGGLACPCLGGMPC